RQAGRARAGGVQEGRGDSMTVYVTGDIHSGLDMQKLRDWELGDSLTSNDYLIIAGDFGFPWDFSAEECADIAWLESRPYTVLFVDGNHERFDHWEERPMEPWHGGLTQRLSDTSSIRRLMRGEVFELDGSTVFTMGGATSVDRNTACPIPAGGPRSSRTSAISMPRGQGSPRSAGRSTASSPIPARRACSRRRSTRTQAGSALMWTG
ncbi:MAG: metallophosphoesterase, partial [Collinsella sp.]